jgi:hypothetical protein
MNMGISRVEGHPDELVLKYNQYLHTLGTEKMLAAMERFIVSDAMPELIGHIQDEVFADLSSMVYALDEGWVLTYTSTDTYRLEKEDGSDRFASDAQAVEHVYREAFYGSKIHKEAVAFMAAHATPDEIKFIARCASV